MLRYVVVEVVVPVTPIPKNFPTIRASRMPPAIIKPVITYRFIGFTPA
jgi:hypothetical protein